MAQAQASVQPSANVSGGTMLSGGDATNSIVERNSAHMWLPMTDQQHGTPYPQLAVGTPYNFQLKTASAWIDRIRIVLYNVDLMFHIAKGTHPGAGTVAFNQGGPLTLLGSNFQVSLKDALVDVQHVAGLSLLMRTFTKYGLRPDFGGYGWEIPNADATASVQTPLNSAQGSYGTYARYLSGNEVTVDSANALATASTYYQVGMYPLYYTFDNSGNAANDAYVHNYVTWMFDFPLTLLMNGAAGPNKDSVGGDWDGICPTDSDSPLSVSFTSTNVSDLIGGDAYKNLVYVNTAATGWHTYDDTGTPVLSIPQYTGAAITPTGNSKYKVVIQNSIQMFVRTITRKQATNGGDLSAPQPYTAYVVKEFQLNNILLGTQQYSFVNRGGGMSLVKCIFIFGNPYTLAADGTYPGHSNTLPFGTIGTPVGMFSSSTGIKQMTPSFSFGNYFEENDQTTNPVMPGTSGAMNSSATATDNQPQIYIWNFLVDQRQKYGILPDGMWVFDWSVGTDTDHPNGLIFPDLASFKNFGVQVELDSNQLQLATTPQGAYFSFLCVFAQPGFYSASAAS